MKTIHNFILEKLKLNAQSKTWSIEDAKVGEFITARKNIGDDIFYVFIFDGIKDNKVHFKAICNSKFGNFCIPRNKDEYFGAFENGKWSLTYEKSSESDKKLFYKEMYAAEYKLTDIGL